MLRHRAILAGAASCVALSLCSCGAARRPAPPLSAEQQAVASANAICAEYLAFARAWASRAGGQPSSAALARLLLVKRSAASRRHAALVAAAGRPAVRDYLSALAARERAILAARHEAVPRPGAAATPSKRALERLYRAASAAYASARALGLSGCIGSPPQLPPG